jgi:hypothetical protein
MEAIMKAAGWVTFLMVIGMTLLVNGQRRGLVGPVWSGGTGWGYHSSTAEEGIQRGMADVIRSQGAANLMNSEAAINIEEARKGYIENRMRWTQTYFDMKRVNREARQEARRPPPTQEQLIRASQARMPDRLTTSQLDPVSGAIAWPTVLMADAYKPYRDQLDLLYAERSKNGYLSPDQFMKIRDITGSMMDELQQQVRTNNYPTSASIEARRFIQGLTLEANMQPS